MLYRPSGRLTVLCIISSGFSLCYPWWIRLSYSVFPPCPQCPGQHLRPCHSFPFPHLQEPHVLKACGLCLLTSLQFLCPHHHHPSWSSYFCFFPGFCSGLRIGLLMSLKHLFRMPHTERGAVRHVLDSVFSVFQILLYLQLLSISLTDKSHK